MVAASYRHRGILALLSRHEIHGSLWNRVLLRGQEPGAATSRCDLEPELSAEGVPKQEVQKRQQAALRESSGVRQ